MGASNAIKSYLKTSDGELVYRHCRLVLAVDDLVGHQTGSGDEALCHTILPRSVKSCNAFLDTTYSYEQNGVLGFPLVRACPHGPVGNCLAVTIVVESRDVVAGLVQSNLAIGLGGNINKDGGLGSLGEKGLIIGEVPSLDLSLFDTKELSDWHGTPTFLFDGEGELSVRVAGWNEARLATVERRVNLKTDVKVLTGEEVGLVRWEDTA